MQPCKICTAPSTDEYCSWPCESGKDALDNAKTTLLELKGNPADQRIFFYDHPLSDLFDLYTITMLKFANEKRGRIQNMHYKNATNLWKSIETKLNRRYISVDIMNVYYDLLDRLYKCNARMWAFRKMAMTKRWEILERAAMALDYLEEDEKRSQIKHEIDIMYDNHSLAEKNYE